MIDMIKFKKATPKISEYVQKNPIALIEIVQKK